MTPQPSAVLFTILLTAVSVETALLLSQLTRPAAASPLPTVTVVASSRSQRPVLDLPENWVAFSARIRVFSPDMPRVEGRFYRSSDGSQRVETGPAAEPARTIDIRNIGQQLNYLFATTKENPGIPSWSSAPMQIPEFGGFKPLKHFADQDGLQNYPYKLSFRAGDGEPSLFADTGFDVYLYLDRGGNIHLQAPALNMLDLVNQSITGRREEIYDIVLGEPDPSLFLPPPGMPVTHQTEPRGLKIRRR